MSTRALSPPRRVANRGGTLSGPIGMYPGLITVRWLASQCEVSVGTVYNWIDRGTVTATRLDWTWRMWGPTVAAELEDEHDVGPFADRPPSTGPAGYVDTATVATWLGVSEMSARQMARTGALPSVRVGPAFRFHWPSLLELFLAGSSSVGAQAERCIGGVDSDRHRGGPS